MELLFRIAGAALCALVSGLLIRRTNPELAAALSVGMIAAILLAALRMFTGLSDAVSLLRERFGLGETYIRPLLKCLAAALVTKLTADLCRDSSQTAAASAVELAGSLCALGVVMPLLLGMLKTAGELF